jgi:hypothetical protein
LIGHGTFFNGTLVSGCCAANLIAEPQRHGQLPELSCYERH